MRTLSRNEQTLAIALGSCVFIVANMFAISWIADRVKLWRHDIDEKKTEVAVARQIVAEKPHWEARQAWMAEHPLQPFDERTSSAAFWEEVQTDLQKHNLKITSRSYLDADHVGDLVTVPLDLTVEGRLQDIITWLHTFQQPGRYQLIKSFKLKQASSGNIMQMDIRLGRVYRTGDIASSP